MRCVFAERLLDIPNVSDLGRSVSQNCNESLLSSSFWVLRHLRCLPLLRVVVMWALAFGSLHSQSLLLDRFVYMTDRLFRPFPGVQTNPHRASESVTLHVA